MANGVEKFTGIAQTVYGLLDPAKLPEKVDQNKDKKVDREELIGYVLQNFKDLSDKIKTQLEGRFAKAGLDVHQVLPGDPRKVSDTLVKKGKEWEDNADKLKKEKHPGQALASHQKAKEAYKLAVELDPKNPAAQAALAEFLYEEGNRKEARFHVQEAIKNQTSTPELVKLKDLVVRCDRSIDKPWDFVGLELTKVKRYKEASAVFLEAAKGATDPKIKEQYTERSLLADELANPYRQGFTTYEDPTLHSLHKALRAEGIPSALIDGKSSPDRKIGREEIVAFCKAHANDDRVKNALKSCGITDKEIGLIVATHADPKNAAAFKALGDFYMAERKAAGAEAAYGQALPLNPSDKAVERGLWEAHYANSDLERPYAFRHFEDVRAEVSKKFEEVDRLSQAGKWDEAAKALKDAEKAYDGMTSYGSVIPDRGPGYEKDVGRLQGLLYGYQGRVAWAKEGGENRIFAYEQYRGAAMNLEIAVEKDPKDAKSAALLTEAKQKMKEHLEAASLAYADKNEKLGKKSEEIDTLIKAGKWSKAERSLKEAQKALSALSAEGSALIENKPKVKDELQALEAALKFHEVRIALGSAKTEEARRKGYEQLEAAAALLNVAVKNDPKDALSASLLTQARTQIEGYRDEAAGRFDKIKAEVEKKFEGVDALTKAGKWAQAERRLKEMEKEMTGPRGDLTYYASVLKTRGPGYEADLTRFTGTAKLYEARVGLATGATDDARQKALEKYQAAAKILDTATKNNPKDYKSPLLLVEANHYLQNYRSAAVNYVKAAERAPEEEKKKIVLQFESYLTELSTYYDSLGTLHKEAQASTIPDYATLYRLSNQRLKIAETLRDVEALKALGFEPGELRKLPPGGDAIPLGQSMTFLLGTDDEHRTGMWLKIGGLKTKAEQDANTPKSLRLDEAQEAHLATSKSWGGKATELKGEVKNYTNEAVFENYLGKIQEVVTQGGMTQDDLTGSLKRNFEIKDGRVQFTQEFLDAYKPKPDVILIGVSLDDARHKALKELSAAALIKLDRKLMAEQTTLAKAAVDPKIQEIHQTKALYYESQIIFLEDKLNEGRLKMMDFHALVKMNPNLLKDDEIAVMSAQTDTILKGFTLVSLTELQRNNDIMKGRRQQPDMGAFLMRRSEINDSLISAMRQEVEQGRAVTFEEAYTNLELARVRVKANFRSNPDIPKGWMVNYSSVYETLHVASDEWNKARQSLFSKMDQIKKDPAAEYADIPTIRIHGGVFAVFEPGKIHPMQVKIGKEGGAIIVGATTFKFPPSDREVTVFLKPHSGFEKEVVWAPGLKEGTDFKYFDRNPNHVLGTNWKTGEYQGGHPAALDAIFDKWTGWKDDKSFKMLFDRETREGLESRKTPEAEREYNLKLAKDLRGKSEYALAGEIFESVFEKHIQDAKLKFEMENPDEVKAIRNKYDNATEREKIEKEVRESLKKQGRVETDEQIKARVKLGVEGKIELDLRRKSFQIVDDWVEMGHISTDKVGTEAWKQYEDMLDPNDRFWNLSDSTWDSIKTELIITAITLPLTLGVGTAIRAGMRGTALAIQLMRAGRIAKFGTEAVIIGTSAFAEGILMEGLQSGMTGRDFSWKGAGLNVLTSFAFHGGGAAWSKVAGKLNVDHTLLSVSKQLAKGEMALDDAAASLAKLSGRTVDESRRLLVDLAGKNLAGRKVANFAGMMSMQTGLSTSFTYLNDWVLGHQNPHDFWDRLGGEGFRQLAFHGGTWALNKASKNWAHETESRSRIKSEMAYEVYRKEIRLGTAKDLAWKKAIAEANERMPSVLSGKKGHEIYHDHQVSMAADLTARLGLNPNSPEGLGFIHAILKHDTVAQFEGKLAKGEVKNLNEFLKNSLKVDPASEYGLQLKETLSKALSEPGGRKHLAKEFPELFRFVEEMDGAASTVLHKAGLQGLDPSYQKALVEHAVKTGQSPDDLVKMADLAGKNKDRLTAIVDAYGTIDGKPLSQTPAGRVLLADVLLQAARSSDADPFGAGLDKMLEKAQGNRERLDQIGQLTGEKSKADRLALVQWAERTGKTPEDLDGLIYKLTEGQAKIEIKDGKVKVVEIAEGDVAAQQQRVQERVKAASWEGLNEIYRTSGHIEGIPWKEEFASRILKEAGVDPKSPEYQKQRDGLIEYFKSIEGTTNYDGDWAFAASSLRERMQSGQSIKFKGPKGDVVEIGRWPDAQLDDFSKRIGIQSKSTDWMRGVIESRDSKNPFDPKEAAATLKTLGDAIHAAKKRGDFSALSEKKRVELRLALLVDVLKGKLTPKDAKKIAQDLSKGEITLTPTGGEVIDKTSGRKSPLSYKVEPKKREETVVAAAAYAGKLPKKKSLPQDTATTVKPPAPARKEGFDGSLRGLNGADSVMIPFGDRVIPRLTVGDSTIFFHSEKASSGAAYKVSAVGPEGGVKIQRGGKGDFIEVPRSVHGEKLKQVEVNKGDVIQVGEKRFEFVPPEKTAEKPVTQEKTGVQEKTQAEIPSARKKAGEREPAGTGDVTRAEAPGSKKGIKAAEGSEGAAAKPKAIEFEGVSVKPGDAVFTGGDAPVVMKKDGKVYQQIPTSEGKLLYFEHKNSSTGETEYSLTYQGKEGKVLIQRGGKGDPEPLHGPAKHGEKAPRARINDGDVLVIGDKKLTFHSPEKVKAKAADGDKTAKVSYTDKTRVQAPDAKNLEAAKPEQGHTIPEVGKELSVEWSAEAKGGKVTGKVKGLKGVEFMVAEGDPHIRSDQRLTVNGELKPEGVWIALNEGDTVRVGQEYYARRQGKLERIQPAADDAPVFAYGEHGVILDNGDGKTLTKVGDSKLRNQQLDAEQKALGILQQNGVDFVPPLIGRPASGELIIGVVEGKSLNKLSAAERKAIPADAWDRFEVKLLKLKALGIHHNDVSAGNIIWTGKDLKLIDFGLAEIGVKSGDDMSRARKIRKAVAEGKEGQDLAPFANMKDTESAQKVKVDEIPFEPAGLAKPKEAPTAAPKEPPSQIGKITQLKEGKGLDPSVYEVKVQTAQGEQTVQVRLDASRTKQLYGGKVEAHLKDVLSHVDLNATYKAQDGSTLKFTGEILGEGSTGTVFVAKQGDKTVAVKIRTHGERTLEEFNRMNAADVRKMKMLSEVDPAYQGATLVALPGGKMGEVMPHFDPATTVFFDNIGALKPDQQKAAKAQIDKMTEFLGKKGFDTGDVEFALTADGKVHILDVEGVRDRRFDKMKMDSKVQEAVKAVEEKTGAFLPSGLVESLSNPQVSKVLAGLDAPAAKAILEVGALNANQAVELNGKKIVFTGEILGVGSGRTVYRGYVVENGVKTPVAIKMLTHSTGGGTTRAGEIKALEVFSRNGLGVVFYGEPGFKSLNGKDVPSIVTNLAEGPVVGKLKDIPEADRAEVSRQVARDMAIATREGLNFRGDIQFVLARDADGKPLVRWIDLESMGRPETGKKWEDAYRAGLENFFGKDFLAKNPDAVPANPQEAVKIPLSVLQTQKGDVTKGTADVYKVKINTGEGPKETTVRLDPEISANAGGAEKNLSHTLSFVNLDKAYDAPGGGKLRFTGNILGQGSASTVFEARLTTPDGGQRLVAVKMRTHPRPPAALAESPNFDRKAWEADVKQSAVREGQVAKEVGKFDKDYAGSGLMTGEKGLQGLVVPRFDPESSVFFKSLSELSSTDLPKVGPQLKAMVEAFAKAGHAMGDVEFVYDKKSGKVHLVDAEGVMLNDPLSKDKFTADTILDVPGYTADPKLFETPLGQDSAPSGKDVPGQKVSTTEMKFDTDVLDLLTGTGGKDSGELKAPDLPPTKTSKTSVLEPGKPPVSDVSHPPPAFPKMKADSVSEPQLRSNVEAIERKRDELLSKVETTKEVQGSSETYTPARMKELVYDVLERGAPLESLSASEGMRAAADEYMTAVVDYSKKNFPEAWKKAEKAENRNPYTGESLLSGKTPNYEAQYRLARMLYNEKLGLPLYGEPSPREKARLKDVMETRFPGRKGEISEDPKAGYADSQKVLADEMLRLTPDFQAAFRKADPATKALMIEAFFGDQIHRPVQDPNAAFQLAVFLGKQGFYRELGVSVDLAASPPQYYFSLGNLGAVNPLSKQHFTLLHTHPEKYFNPKGQIMGNEATLNVERVNPEKGLVPNTSSVLFSPQDIREYKRYAEALAKAGKDVPGLYDAKSRTFTNWVQQRFGVAEVKITLNAQGTPEKIAIRFGVYEIAGLDSQYKATESMLNSAFAKESLTIEKVKPGDIESGMPRLTPAQPNPAAADRLAAAGGAGELRYPREIFGLAKADETVAHDQFLGVKVDPPFERGLTLLFSTAPESPFMDFAVEGARVLLKERNVGRADRKEKVPGFKQDAGAEMGFDHIVDRHEHDSTKRGDKKAGVYAENVDIEIMGKETIRSWDRAQLTYDPDGRAVFILQRDFPQKVGKTTNGKDTQTNQVILSYDGEINSSFPVEKPKKGWVERGEVASNPADFARKFVELSLTPEIETRYAPFLPAGSERSHLYLADVPVGIINSRTRARYFEAVERASKAGEAAPMAKTEDVTVIIDGKKETVKATVVEIKFSEPIGVREKKGPDGQVTPEPLYYNRTYFYKNQILGGYPIAKPGEAALPESVWNSVLRPQDSPSRTGSTSP